MTNPDPALPRVALFRAREEAAGSAERLAGLGFAVARLPAFETVPLPVRPRRARYDAVIATSAKAFLAEPPLDRASPLYVVGARTARAAQARGFRLAAPPAPGSAGLVDILRRALPPAASVLYLAGRDRKAAIEAALAGADGLEVAIAYAAEARAGWSADEIGALQRCAFALHYSRRSAAVAARLAEAGGAGPQFRRMTHVCLSNDAAEPARAAGVARVRVADRPEEAALLATLVEAVAVFPSLDPSRI